MVQTVKFSQFAAVNLSNSTNQVAGVSSTGGSGTNFIAPFPLVWTTATRPSASVGLTGYNTSLGQLEVYNGTTWVQLAAGGSGSVNLGAQNQLAWYASTGTAVSGLMTANNSILTTNGSGVPSWTTSLPSGLTITNPTITGATINNSTINQPNIVGIINGSSAAAGSVGEIISSVILENASLSLTNNTPADLTHIQITPGQWIAWGNYFMQSSTTQNLNHANAWINTASASTPDAAYISTFAGFAISIGNFACPVPMQPFNVTVNTNLYLSVNAGFGAGSVSACGGIYALRVR